MMGATCFMPSMTERTLVAKVASKRSTSRPSIPPVWPGPPALLNRQSMRPSCVWVSVMRPRTSSSSDTSVVRKLADAPSAPAISFPRSDRRPASTTVAPSSTKRAAVALPIPLVAPVTMHTLPASFPFALMVATVVSGEGRASLNRGGLTA